LLQTGEKMTLAELLSFPTENDSPEEAARKQAKLLGKSEPPEPKVMIADWEDYGSPPPAIDKRFTGRLSQWKGNGK
jgi:hypothetical protein